MEDGDLIAGVELGGTKSVAVVARGRTILRQARFATTTPDETLSLIGAQIRGWHAEEPFSALGIGSFGPIRLDPEARDHGFMLQTPKPGWSGADVAGALTRGHDLPWIIDTDVNAAALAEARWGVAADVASACYITLGTGVGGGLVLDALPVHGALHPEIGHLRLRRADGDAFAGICPFHGDCVEGLISGPALQARFGLPGERVADDDPRWSFVIHDLASLITAVSLTASPARVVIGGGIGLGRPFLMAAVRAQVLRDLGGYLPHVAPSTIDGFIVPAGLGADAGPLGAVALGYAALRRSGEGREVQHG